MIGTDHALPIVRQSKKSKKGSETNGRYQGTCSSLGGVRWQATSIGVR